MGMTLRMAFRNGLGDGLGVALGMTLGVALGMTWGEALEMALGVTRDGRPSTQSPPPQQDVVLGATR